jgi:hypothetical protein
MSGRNHSHPRITLYGFVGQLLGNLTNEEPCTHNGYLLEELSLRSFVTSLDGALRARVCVSMENSRRNYCR